MPHSSPDDQPQRFQSIRFRLTSALAIALLPVLVLSTLQSIATYNREVRQQRDALIEGARRSAAVARARLSRVVLTLKTLAPDVDLGDCERRIAEAAALLPGHDQFVRYAAAGRAVCASGPSLANTADSGWFKTLQRGRSAIVARAPRGLEREPSLQASVRIDRDRRFDGAFTVILPLSALRSNEPDPALPKGVEAAVVDAEGAVLTASDRRSFPERVQPPMLRTGTTGAAVTYGVDSRGRERLFSVGSMGEEGVFFILSAPTQGLFSWALLNPMVTFVLPLLAWAVAVAAVLAVADRVVIRWLTYLERIAAIYAKGRLSVRPIQAVNAPLEIRNLARTLDEMADAIDGRDASLRESLAHKDALMREIHHRVKNNLQVISSLLNMQQRSLKDPAARVAMSDTRQRITALSLIYRALYQSPDLKRVDVRQFLEELIAQLVSADAARGPVIHTELQADALVIDPDKLAPLALWAVEAITNAQKHAFAEQGGRLAVRFTVGGQESRLEVEDDGPGAENDGEALGVGRTLMNAFARQLRGHAEIVRAPSGGTLARLTFPTPEAGEAESGAHAGAAGPDDPPGETRQAAPG